MPLPRAATIALAPLLAAQAYVLMRRTPRLPEAEGARQGVRGGAEAPALRLLIIGDSSAAGVGAPTQDDALAGRLTAALAPRFHLHWTLIARSGARTADALRWIARGLEPADVVVTALGVNDVLRLTAPRRWAEEQARLRQALLEATGARHVYHSGVPPMGGFPIFPQPLRWALGQEARRLDSRLAAQAASAATATHLAAPPLPTPDLFATDGMHPGPKGYTLWAGILAAEITARFAPPEAVI